MAQENERSVPYREYELHIEELQKQLEATKLELETTKLVSSNCHRPYCLFVNTVRRYYLTLRSGLTCHVIQK